MNVRHPASLLVKHLVPLETKVARIKNKRVGKLMKMNLLYAISSAIFLSLLIVLWLKQSYVRKGNYCGSSV